MSLDFDGKNVTNGPYKLELKGCLDGAILSRFEVATASLEDVGRCISSQN